VRFQLVAILKKIIVNDNYWQYYLRSSGLPKYGANDPTAKVELANYVMDHIQHD
jgi:hypothetical protein